MNMQEYEPAARKAYHAYGSVTDYKNYLGKPMPAYDDLPERIQAAWLAATKAAHEACLGVT